MAPEDLPNQRLPDAEGRRVLEVPGLVIEIVGMLIAMSASLAGLAVVVMFAPWLLDNPNAGGRFRELYVVGTLGAACSCLGGGALAFGLWRSLRRRRRREPTES